MQKKLSTLAICAVVAVVAFIAGTMFSTITATTTRATSVDNNIVYLGPVSANGKIYVMWRRANDHNIELMEVTERNR